MANATLADVQYQLERLYRNKGYIADLSFGQDAFLGTLKKRRYKPKIGGQADVLAVNFDGAGNPSNVVGTTGTAAPSQGVQFLVTPAQLTNLAGISSIAAASGSSDVATIVKPLKYQIDQAIKKTAKHGAIQLWQDGFPSLGTIENVGANTTLDLVDSDDIVKLSVGDRLVAAAARTTGGLRATVLTVVKVNANGTAVVDQNVNTSWVNGDTIFLENTRIGSAVKQAITGVQGWLPGTPGTLFGVDTTVDYRLSGMTLSASASDIEGAFIDGIAQCLTFSSNGTKDITAWMHPKTWATLAKAMQSKTVVISPSSKKAREGEISFSGWAVSTPNGTIDVMTPQFCPKNTIFMLNMETWELVSWGTDFPSIVAPALGAGPPVFFDPATGNITAAVGGFPQLECNAPGWNLTISLT